jgi:hypothetical protein
LTLLDGAPPPWFCGSAMPRVRRRISHAIAQGQWLQPACAVNPQQSEIVVLVLGEAIGTAVAGNRNRKAAVGNLASAMMAPSSLTTTPVRIRRSCAAADRRSARLMGTD